MWTLLFERALPHALFENVRAEVCAHAQSETACQHSFWFPLNAEPRLFVEHCIVALRRLLPTADRVTGVEWWVPVMSPTQGMEWHRDCDRIIYNREKRFVSPTISSVFYVESTGGPTLVADEIPIDHYLKRPSAELGCMAFQPAPNRYAIFPGDRLHAVAITSGDRPRITLAINWWLSKPSAPLCIEPPYEGRDFIAFHAPSGFSVGLEPAMKVVPLELSAEHLAALPHRRFCPIYTPAIGP